MYKWNKNMLTHTKTQNSIKFFVYIHITKMTKNIGSISVSSVSYSPLLQQQQQKNNQFCVCLFYSCIMFVFLIIENYN
jgi:hypothetical protein